MSNLVVAVPETLSQTERGDFFEDLVAGLLKPMRFEVVERVRFTGMEIRLVGERSRPTSNRVGRV